MVQPATQSLRPNPSEEPPVPGPTLEEPGRRGRPDSPAQPKSPGDPTKGAPGSGWPGGPGGPGGPVARKKRVPWPWIAAGVVLVGLWTYARTAGQKGLEELV